MVTQDQIIKILLVDDEKDIRDVLEILLLDMGYTVFAAENGEQALELFQKQMPPIVMTDIKMPGLNGIDILQKIKSINPDTEIIMMTGHGDTDLAIKSLKYEAVDFISKPISDDVLEIALNRAKEKIFTRLQLRKYTQNLEKLLREKSELQDHLSSLGMMIGSISHGIKGLLTRLDCGIYLVGSAHENKEYEEIYDGLQILKETGVRIKKMVLDILYYAKERDLKIENVNAVHFAKEVAQVVEHKALEHHIEFICDFGKDPVHFQIDTERLHSALINVLDNAMDACVEDKQKKYHKVIFAVRQDEKQVLFDIHDNGIGMGHETKEKIFNLFYSSKGSKGTGFGLFVSDNIVKQHKGNIHVHSAKNKGTRFTVKIPKQHMKNNTKKGGYHGKKENTDH